MKTFIQGIPGLKQITQKGVNQMSWEGTSPSALSFDVYSGIAGRDCAGFAPKQQECLGGRRESWGSCLLGPGTWERRDGQCGPCLHRVLINLGHSILPLGSALATDPKANLPPRGHNLRCPKSTRSKRTAEAGCSAASGSTPSRFPQQLRQGGVRRPRWQPSPFTR